MNTFGRVGKNKGFAVSASIDQVIRLINAPKKRTRERKNKREKEHTRLLRNHVSFVAVTWWDSFRNVSERSVPI